MMRVPSWEDNDVVKREVKSCDNHEVGEVQEVNPAYLVVKKGSRMTRIPRAAVATFDGDKLYLRATEAEVLAGIYPFRESGYGKDEVETLQTRGMQSPPPPQAP